MKSSSEFLLLAGDVPRVDGQLAVARAFGDKSLKMHLSSEPDVFIVEVDQRIEFLILASDGIWKVSSLIIFFLLQFIIHFLIGLIKWSFALSIVVH